MVVCCAAVKELNQYVNNCQCLIPSYFFQHKGFVYLRVLGIGPKWFFLFNFVSDREVGHTFFLLGMGLFTGRNYTGWQTSEPSRVFLVLESFVNEVLLGFHTFKACIHFSSSLVSSSLAWDVSTLPNLLACTILPFSYCSWLTFTYYIQCTVLYNTLVTVPLMYIKSKLKVNLCISAGDKMIKIQCFFLLLSSFVCCLVEQPCYHK